MSREWVKTTRNISVFAEHVCSASLLLHPELDLVITPEAISDVVGLLDDYVGADKGIASLFVCGDKKLEKATVSSAAVFKDIGQFVRAGLVAKLKFQQRRVIEHKQCSMMLVAWNRFYGYKEKKTLEELLTFPVTGPAKKADLAAVTQIQLDDLQQRLGDYCTATGECTLDSVDVLSHSAQVKVKRECISGAFSFLVLIKTCINCERVWRNLPGHDGSNFDKWWVTVSAAIINSRTWRTPPKQTHTQTRAHSRKNKEDVQQKKNTAEKKKTYKRASTTKPARTDLDAALSLVEQSVLEMEHEAMKDNLAVLSGAANHYQGAFLKQHAEADLKSMIASLMESFGNMKEAEIVQIASTSPFDSAKYKALCDSLSGKSCATVFGEKRTVLLSASLFVFLSVLASMVIRNIATSEKR